MDTNTYGAGIDPGLLAASGCERAFACRDSATDCVTMRFTNRDLDVVKCLDKMPCNKRRSYDGMQICTCTVRRRRHGLQ
jgi:hypothetical protein